MKKIKSITGILYFAILALMVACGGGGGGEQPAPEPEPNGDLPVKSIGTLPVNGEPCSDYEEVTSDASKVSITFKWNAAQYTQSYMLTILEGTTEVSNGSYTVLEAKVQLDRGKTYTWYLTSVNDDGQTKGDTYSFTTPGTPIGNYAPYAAQITIGFDTGTMEMSVNWIGGDEDADVLTYDVKVWENDIILMEEVDYTLDSLPLISFISGESYTVEVVSKDSSGNYSVSTVSETAPE